MIDSDLMEEIMEEVNMVGQNAEGVFVVKSIKSDALTLNEVADATLAFLRAFGYDYVNGVEFHCGDGVTHGSTV